MRPPESKTTPPDTRTTPKAEVEKWLEVQKERANTSGDQDLCDQWQKTSADLVNQELDKREAAKKKP